jgi:hypothetical protein
MYTLLQQHASHSATAAARNIKSFFLKKSLQLNKRNKVVREKRTASLKIAK